MKTIKANPNIAPVSFFEIFDSVILVLEEEVPDKMHLGTLFPFALKYAMFMLQMIILSSTGAPHVRTQLKQQQINVIWAFLNGLDVLAVLPTGFGKSICYQLLPFIFDFLRHGQVDQPFQILPQLHSCLIISPLISLMEDQLAFLDNHGIVAIRWEAETEALLFQQTGQLPIFVFVSPESLSSKKFVSFAKDFSKRTICVGVDEAHCISTWGHDFRPAYMAIGDMRAFFPHCNVLALTATATSHVQNEIKNCLHFRENKSKIIFQIPLMGNVYFDVRQKKMWRETYIPNPK